MKGGLSGCRGIMLYETAKEGNNSVYGYYENGNIVLKTGNMDELKNFKKQQEKPYITGRKKEYSAMLLLLLIMIVFVTVVFITCPLRYFFGAIILAAAAYMPLLILWFANVNIYDSNKTRMQFRRFHGCEHTLLKYMSKYVRGEKPEVELDDLKKASYYDSECGTVYCGYLLFLLAVITAMVLNFASIGLLKFIGILIGTVILLFINIFNPLNPFKLLQRPAVAQPTDYEYALGLKVLKKFKDVMKAVPETPEAENCEAEQAEK